MAGNWCDEGSSSSIVNVDLGASDSDRDSVSSMKPGKLGAFATTYHMNLSDVGDALYTKMLRVLYSA